MVRSRCGPGSAASTASVARRWNERYSRPGRTFRFAPDQALLECGSLLPPPGRALEIACGTGGNALWLAARGFDVIAADLALAGVRLARDEARRLGVPLQVLVADALSLPLAARFDLVVVTRFLDRALFPLLRRLPRPGGCLFYRTFNQRRRQSHPSFNPDYLLQDGELERVFQGYQVLAASEACGEAGDSSYLLARRPTFAA